VLLALFTAGGFRVLTAQTPTAVNFVDEEIQARWTELNRTPAPPSNDVEFFRRLNLDLTGRLPSPEQIRAFLADESPAKRNLAIDRLLETPEFTDRWSKWLLDLMHISINIYRGFTGRDAFPVWLRDQVGRKQRLDDIVSRVITSTGNNYDVASGGTNFFLVTPPSGPKQDTYDLLFARAATSFLGMGHYDCLLCHNGRGHLDGISSWGARTTRAEAWQMSSFFSRFKSTRASLGGAYFDSNIVSDAATGAYELNTTEGNRPVRRAVAGKTTITPVYRTGAQPQSEDWRGEFARQVVRDPMFARNFANRIWKQMMGEGLAEPVDALDPDRLDPASPPPEPWGPQASHPALLEKLAGALARDFDLRDLVRLIAQSKTYQLASVYADATTAEHLYLYHKPRRLDAEQVHDAITGSTAVPARYRLRTTDGYQDPPEQWAMRLPGSIHGEETDEATLDFLQSFFPGDGNLLPRSSSSSVMQELNLMNSPFVVNRAKLAVSPALQAAALLDNDKAVEQVFLLFLSRLPTTVERTAALTYLNSGSRDTALEDLAWTCLNRPEFLINH
jgi:hypothetical protein